MQLGQIQDDEDVRDRREANERKKVIKQKVKLRFDDSEDDFGDGVLLSDKVHLMNERRMGKQALSSRKKNQHNGDNNEDTENSPTVVDVTLADTPNYRELCEYIGDNFDDLDTLESLDHQELGLKNEFRFFTYAIANDLGDFVDIQPNQRQKFEQILGEFMGKVAAKFNLEQKFESPIMSHNSTPESSVGDSGPKANQPSKMSKKEVLRAMYGKRTAPEIMRTTRPFPVPKRLRQILP